MGVHGLTSYLRAHSASLAISRLITQNDRVSFVIDGWSFIYETLALLDLPWVYGGEYPHFSHAITQIVQAWLSLGINLYFVFDGPYPELKFPTIISRTTQNTIKPSLLFFRTSPISRSKRPFLRESAMLPPRAYSACIQTLQSTILTLSPHDVLEMHFADEEGDPYAVELAARLNAYVLGKDSDFVILNAEGYQGYVPLDEIIWSLSVDDPSSISNDTDSTWGDDDDGFQTVVNSKSKRKAYAHQQNHLHSGVISGHGILPPPPPSSSNTPELSLTITIYTSTSLASHLSIPLSLLPLLAALVGNDFTNDRPDSSSSSITQTTNKQTNLQWLFFDHKLSLIQRITRVSSTLHSILKAAVTPSSSSSSASTTKIKEKNRVSSVMELIDRAVGALIVRNIDHLGMGERERVVERVVEATLQYAISVPRREEEGGEGEGRIGQKWASEVCAVHEEGACPLVLLRTQQQDDVDDQSSVFSSPSSPHTPSSQQPPTQQQQQHLQKLYTTAYRTGRLSPQTLNVLHTGTFFPRLFLENPDLESVVVSFGRPVMVWVYAILDDVFGIPVRVSEVEGEEGGEGDGKMGGGIAGKAGEEEGEDEDEDELIDVVEESDTEEEDDTEDPLAPLRGALQQLNHTSSSSSSAVSRDGTISEEQKPKKREVVEEYVRRGTRLKAEEVEVPLLSELLVDQDPSTPIHSQPSSQTHHIPIALRPVEDRLRVLLLAIGTPRDELDRVAEAVKGLPSERRVPVLTLRAVLWRLRERARESGSSSGSREREKEKWTREEGRAFLASFDYDEKKARVAEDGEKEEEEEVVVPITDRNVQLTAQVLATIDAVERLAECLFLSSPSPYPSPYPPSPPPRHSNSSNTPNSDPLTEPFLPSPSTHFSGRTFHTHLTHLKPLPPLSPDSVSKKMWDVVCLGLDVEGEEGDGVFGEGVESKRRKKKDKEKGAGKGNGGGGEGKGGKKTVAGGKFGLLAVE